MLIASKLSFLQSSLRTGIIGIRHSSSAATSNGVTSYCYNRNPRNLEKLRIAHKPIGRYLDKPGISFWNKLVIKYNRSSRSITSQVVHNSGCVVVSASTNEWALSKFLYSKNDTSAHLNLARVFAQRCIESGISEMACFIERQPGTKIDLFMAELEKEGIVLEEPPQYEHPKPSDILRPEKPWEVF